MGQHRAKPQKAPVTRESITPLTIQRLVAAVADNMSTRLKVLAGRHSKQDIISVTEPLSRMNLVQISVVMNNIAAVQFLLSIGASKDVLWDPLDGVENSWDLSYMPDRVFNDFQNFCINLASLNVAQHAYEHSGLSLLHMAALVGHKEMVRFLVEQAGIPVDVRAAVTGATPLMTAITRGCVTESGLEGPPTHVCGIPASNPDASEMTCSPIWPITDLLLELGADLGAVDNSGACLLATAAEAGRYGMLNDLIGRYPEVLERCPTHAGHLLYAIVSNWVRTGTVETRLESEIFQLIKRGHTRAGHSQRFWEEIAAPIKRRKSAVVDRVLKVLPGNESMVTHAMCRVMIGKSSNRYPAMKYLIEQGVPVSALRLGQQHYTVTGHCDYEMLMMTLNALLEVHGQKFLEEHYDLLFGLWADSILHPFEPCPELLATRQTVLQKCIKFFTGTGKLHDQSVWPTRFSPELCERFDFCALGKPVSPLVLAAAGGVPGAVHSFTHDIMMTYPGDPPEPRHLTLLNQLDPCGRLPLIEAIVRGRIEEAEELVACGADFAVADDLGRTALHEVARLGTAAMELGKFCLSYLPFKDAETLSKIMKSMATGAHVGPPKRATLADMIVFGEAWYMLPELVQLGMDVHWTPDDERRGKLLYEAMVLNADLVDPAFLTGPSLPAALRAVHGACKATALGWAVVVGQWGWLKPMLDVCRREGLDVDELLGWHVCPSKDDSAHPILFHAVKHGNAVELLMEAGYDFGPFMGYCIDGPVHGELGKDETPDTVVWERFSMLMWAATFGQPVAVKSLLRIGMDPNFQPTPKNKWVPTAMSAALKWPLIAPMNPPEITLGDKLECILALLRWKAAITQDQLSQILYMMYKAQRSKVARELWAFLHKKAAACAACGLIGDWRTCADCKAAFYCSRACQRSHWLKHRGTCQHHVCDKVAQAGSAAPLSAAPDA